MVGRWRERESERAGVERALIALSLFARSFSLFVRLLWLSFYFGLHCGFAVVAAFFLLLLLQRQSAINVIKVIRCRSAVGVALAAAAARTGFACSLLTL